MEIANVLAGNADIDGKYVKDSLVEEAVAADGRGRDSHAFLMNFGKGAGKARGHGAAHIGVVDVARDEADKPAAGENRLPKMEIWRMGRDVTAVGIIRDPDVPILVTFGGTQHSCIIDAH